jgi:CPA1 family monovalent cation:H+ antiporter
MTLSIAALVFWMLLAITLFAIVSRLVRIPYPIVMLAGGALIGLVPGIAPVRLAPDVVFLVLLPLLLFGGGWATDWRLFKQYLGPILWLALVLVIVTTVAVAFVAHVWMGLPLASAFVLGAILSPSDAIATEAIAEEIPFPQGAEAILSGESLVNDAAALVIYAFAITAASNETFSFGLAAADFVYVSLAGIGIGLAIAWIMYRVAVALDKANLNDELMGVLLSFVTPFMTYLPAQAAQASGVLAAVSGGVFLSARSDRIFSAEQRIAAAAVWTTVTFVLNGVAFILVGLQLRSALSELGASNPITLTEYAFGIAALVIVLRIAATFAGGTIRWFVLKAKGRDMGPRPAFGDIFITSWSGMRGIVTLAGALAIPSYTAAGHAFPGRALILFLAFTTIVITLVGQGLTLPWIVRRFGTAPGDDYAQDLAKAQLRIASAGRERLRELEAGFTSTQEWEAASRVIATLEQRMARAKGVLDGPDAVGSEASVESIDRKLFLAACEAEHAALVEMRRKGEIGDRAYRETQYSIDLAESLLRGDPNSPVH